MRRTETKIIQTLKEKPLKLKTLASKIDKSQSWTSEVVSDLEDEGLVETDTTITLADTYEADLLKKLSKKFDLDKILGGKKEDILRSLHSSKKTVSELEKEGFAKSTIYEALSDLKEVGVISEEGEGYKIKDEILRDFLKARTRQPFLESHRSGEETIIKTEENVEGEPTAFSAFDRYGVRYMPSENYFYRGETTIKIENVLIHALKFAENKKQMSICGVFYLKRGHVLNNDMLWKLTGKWDCLEKFADLLSYLDQREVKRSELFPPWDEFIELCRDYDVYPRNKFSEKILTREFEHVGKQLSQNIDVYLIGGGNLILRDLKDSTKDIDIVLEGKKDLDEFVNALQKAGYKKNSELKDSYDRLGARTILEKSNHPRWDLFVEKVAGLLRLTEEMKARVTKKEDYGDLTLNLVSLTDIFLFKSVTDREGDLEDAALIMEQGEVDWDLLMEEIKRQERIGEKIFSFSVLTTLDILKERYDLESPLKSKLSSHCLEKALLLSLEEEKTTKELKKEVDFPAHQIYNKLRKLEDEGKIEVDRESGINKYRVK
ncbi:MAG: helix-turn-helix domain-containing protein [Candidatus Natronoplasma sp.]